MNRMRNFGILLSVFLLGVSAGCAEKTKVVTKPREDQTLVGNQGYLVGTPPATKQETPSTRTYYETQVAIPTFEVNIKIPPWRREWADKDLSGNRGYLVGGPYQKTASAATPEPMTSAPARKSFFFHPPEPSVTEEPVAKEASYGTYTVQKGETLGEISAKVYGTSRKWKKIFEANQDVLKNPNRIKAGQVLRIPRGEEPSRPSRAGTIK